jgi:hypothetical protein
VVQRALEAAADQLFREGRAVPAGSAMAEDVTSAQRRADALGLLAETALSAALDTGSAGDRYQVVVHVEASGHGDALVGGSLELDHGAVCVSAETSRRVACDASVVVMRHDDDGGVLDVGRKSRTSPPHIRRAVAARDATCCFPGCTARRCDAHHLEHWADGGATSLDNLLLLCRRHHRAVHEGGFHVVRAADGAWAFHQPDGRLIPRAPDAPLDAWEGDEAMPELASSPVWDGTPFNLAWAIDVLYARTAR